MAKKTATRDADARVHELGSTPQPTYQSVRALTSSGTTSLSGTDGGGVFLSTDGDLTWTIATIQPTSPFVECLTASGTTLLAGTDSGVFHSTDGGLTWTAATTQPMNLNTLSLVARGTTLLAGTIRDGVWRCPL